MGGGGVVSNKRGDSASEVSRFAQAPAKRDAGTTLRATVLLPKYATTVGLGTTRSWRSQSGLRSGLGEEMRTRTRACNRAGGLERDDDSMPEDVRGQRGWR